MMVLGATSHAVAETSRLCLCVPGKSELLLARVASDCPLPPADAKSPGDLLISRAFRFGDLSVSGGIFRLETCFLAWKSL